MYLKEIPCINKVTIPDHTEGYKELQDVTGGYKGLQGVTKDYRNFFLELERSQILFLGLFYIKIKVEEISKRVTRSYKMLQGVTRGYRGLQWVTGGDKRLQGVTGN